MTLTCNTRTTSGREMAMHTIPRSARALLSTCSGLMPAPAGLTCRLCAWAAAISSCTPAAVSVLYLIYKAIHRQQCGAWSPTCRRSATLAARPSTSLLSIALHTLTTPGARCSLKEHSSGKRSERLSLRERWKIWGGSPAAVARHSRTAASELPSVSRPDQYSRLAAQIGPLGRNLLIKVYSSKMLDPTSESQKIVAGLRQIYQAGWVKPGDSEGLQVQRQAGQAGSGHHIC